MSAEGRQSDRPAPDPITGLYVPGDRPDRFDKAVATGAQLVILDLEDAVAADRKQFARDAVLGWLRTRDTAAPGPIIQVRVNAGNADDLATLATLGTDSGPVFEVRLPKVERPEEVDMVALVLPGHAVTALLESACGIENARAIAAHHAVSRLAIGESDLASDLGTRNATTLDYARIRVLFAARAAGLGAPMLSAYTEIRDLDGLRADTERGRDLGWVGRTAIHPSQLPVIASVFRPSAAEIEWAQAVLSATVAGGVSTLPTGEMVDHAMAGRAHAILARAAASGHIR